MRLLLYFVLAFSSLPAWCDEIPLSLKQKILKEAVSCKEYKLQDEDIIQYTHCANCKCARCWTYRGLGITPGSCGPQAAGARRTRA